MVIAHLNIVHAEDVPTVVHVLLQVFVLDEKGRETAVSKSVSKLYSTEGHE